MKRLLEVWSPREAVRGIGFLAILAACAVVNVIALCRVLHAAWRAAIAYVGS